MNKQTNTNKLEHLLHTEPYINRNPDFTEFLFGQQPIQIISGKNESSLYDYNSTMYRLNKALTTWY